MPSIIRDFLEALGPVVATPGEDRDCRVLDMDLHAITVEFDFVQPTLAARCLVDGRCECRFDEAGVGCFGAGRAGSHGSHEPQWQW
jgi:hypothetical protein